MFEQRRSLHPAFRVIICTGCRYCWDGRHRRKSLTIVDEFEMKNNIARRAVACFCRISFHCVDIVSGGNSFVEERA